MTEDLEPRAASPRTSRWSRLGALRNHAENAFVSVFLLAMAVIPVVEFIGRRWFGVGIPGAHEYLQHLTLWVAFLGACLASREGRHLTIAAAERVFPPAWKRRIDWFTGFVSATVCLTLAGASIQLLASEAAAVPESWRGVLPAFLVAWLEPYGLFEPGSLTRIGGWLPVWVGEAVMPFGFLVIAGRFVLRSSPRARYRALAALSIPFAIALAVWGSPYASHFVIPGFLVLIASAVLGAPIFVLLGGSAILLFWGAGVTIAAIPAETYRIVTYPVFPTIPIFTLAGFVLSESRADQRLVRVFREFFGWMPGGTAVAATVVCGFFTTFTGASGVTILALGGLLLPVLIQAGFKERFSIGLLTATGSLGLLLPPSLVVILYAVLARIPVTDMFVAGIIPGLLLVVSICVVCVIQGYRDRVARGRFNPKEAARALWGAKWEVAIPVLALWLIFSGFCTLVEAAAAVVVYALFVEVVIYRDIRVRDVFSVLTQCSMLVGGVLIILGVAMGLTSYLVDAQVPMAAADWAAAHIESRWVFLILLNVALIVVGCLMDIFSALVVVVPIVLPMAEVFGIHPAHLGVIFLANLELGYLTPPIGMNLFLASFRFERPLPVVYKAAVPFLLILLCMVLLITFVPSLTLGLFNLVGTGAP